MEELDVPTPASASTAKTSKLVVALLVLNLGVSGFGLFHALTTDPMLAGGAADHHAPKEKEKTVEITGPLLALDPFVVNLDEPGNARYLRVGIQLELVSADVQPVIQKSLLLVRDAILSHLSGLHLSDTLGPQAKEKLRGELVAKIEGLLGKNKIKRALFQEFVVQ